MSQQRITCAWKPHVVQQCRADTVVDLPEQAQMLTESLYAWGRHHSSLIMLPDTTLLMSYVVRLGYADTPDGLPQYGIEAVLSHDHGRSWQLDRRYILDAWAGAWLDRPLVKLVAPACTSTVLLSDGSLLTAYNTGISGDRRDVKLVRWRLAD